MRVVNVLFVALFAFSLVVQVNDPDPIRWMAIYSAGLVACLAWQFRWTKRRWPYVAVAVAALAWAAISAAATHLTAPVGEALVDWHMHAGGSEELRETLGLLLVAGWCAALAARPVRP